MPRSSLKACVAAAALFTLVDRTMADIVYGPWVFSDNAFADTVEQLEAGRVFTYCSTGSLEAALTGFSPSSMLINIGLEYQFKHSNRFRLGFTDLMAVNREGPDIVFFDARFSPDPYSIAVRVAETGESTFDLVYPAEQFIELTSECSDSTVFGVEIDLSDYGLPIGAVVDAIEFSALRNSRGNVEGDPVMAGVLTPEVRIEIDGACPGFIDLALRGAPANSRIAIVAATAEGSYEIPAGLVCAGTQFGLGSEGLQLVLVADTDAEGAFSERVRAPQSSCGAYLQVISLLTCETSNVVQIP
ncbi:MAG: hypothetical protein ACF8PN_05280 [Phycisphaerales bacterium]